MIATSPMIRTLTSWASRFEIFTGAAVCLKNASRSRRSVGLGAEKVLGQDFCKARNIGGFDRSNVIAVEVEETVQSGLQSRPALHGVLLLNRHWRVKVGPRVSGRSPVNFFRKKLCHEVLVVRKDFLCLRPLAAFRV